MYAREPHKTRKVEECGVVEALVVWCQREGPLASRGGTARARFATPSWTFSGATPRHSAARGGQRLCGCQKKNEGQLVRTLP